MSRWMKSLAQKLFATQKRRQAAVRRQRLFSSFQPRHEQLEARLALATVVAYDPGLETLTFTRDASEVATVTLVDDLAGNQVKFTSSNTIQTVDPNEITTFGAITGGSLYADGYYPDVPLTGGTGVGATANITVELGAVTTVELVNAGLGYTASDSLSADDANLGGIGGSGFQVAVSGVQAVQIFQDNGGGEYETIIPGGVDAIKVDLNAGAGDGATTLVLGSAWNFNISVAYIGAEDSDTLDLSDVAPRTVIASAFGGVDGYDGSADSVTFENLNAVKFGGAAADSLSVALTPTAAVLDFAYAVTGAGSGTLTSGTHSLSFTGLDNADAEAVTLSVLDSVTSDPALGNLVVSATGLANFDTTIVGANENVSPANSAAGKMLIAFAEGSAANLKTTTPTLGLDIQASNYGAGDNVYLGTTAITAATLHATGDNYLEGDIIQLVGGTYLTQATFQVDAISATAVAGIVDSAPVVGGSDYAEGDILTVDGGTPTSPTSRAKILVTAVNSGLITGALLLDAGDYSVLPPSTVTTTHDTGIGDDSATFNLVFSGVISSAHLVDGGSYLALPSTPYSFTAVDNSEATGATFDLVHAYVPMSPPALSIDAGLGTINLLSDLTVGIGSSGNLSLTAANINLNAASIDTTGGTTPSGNATFTGAVLLGADDILINTAGAGIDGTVTFTSTVDADDSSTYDRTLTITAGSGAVNFQGNVGSVASGALADLDVTAQAINLGSASAQTIHIDDDALGAQTATFTGAVTLKSNVTIYTDKANQGDNSVEFDTSVSTIDADTVANFRTLTFYAGGGAVTFDGVIGVTKALADIDVTGSAIHLNASDVKVTAQGGNTAIFAGAVILGTDVTVTTTNNDVTFTSTINADDNTVADRKFTVVASGNAVNFLGDLGTGIKGALADLDVTATTINLGNGPDQTIRVDDPDIAATVSFSGNVVLKSNVKVDTDGSGTDGSVTFNSKINADLAANNRKLAIVAGDGDATFNGVIGDTGALADWDVNAFAINLYATAVGLVPSATVNAQGGNTVTLDGSVAIGATTIWISTDGASDNNITFVKTIQDASPDTRTLRLTAGTGDITFSGAVGGGGQRLDKLTIDSARNVSINSTVDTVGAVTQLAGSGLTSISDIVTAGAASSIKTKNITLTGTGKLDVTGTVTLEAFDNIDLQAGSITKSTSTAALKFGNTNGDTVTVSGTIDATGAIATGTASRSNLLVLNYQTAYLNLPGGLNFVAGGGLVTNQINANGNSLAAGDIFTLSNNTLTKDGNSNVTYSSVQRVTINGGGGADDITTTGGGSAQTTINGDADSDTIKVNTGSHDMVVNGGAGSDSIIVSGGTAITANGDNGSGPVGNDSFSVTGAASGSLYGNDGNDTFTLTATLTGSIFGGNQNDSINLQTNGYVTGSVNGESGTDTLDYTGRSGAVSFTILGTGTTDGFKGSGTGLTGTAPTFDNINTFIGNGTSTTITGLNIDSTWLITGPNAGTYTSSARTFNFSGASSLIGGSAIDTFRSTGSGVFNVDGIFEGVINGGAGNDIIDYSANTVNNTYTVTALNAGSIQGTTPRSFTNVENLKAGSGNDSFKFTTASSSIAGKIDGGGGTDLLDYTGRTTAVQVDLTAGTATGTGGIVLLTSPTRSSIENVTGTSLNDIIFGDVSNNVLVGNGGNDILVGNAGNDTLSTSNTGRSVLIGSAGNDTLTAGSSGGDVLIGNATTYDANKTALAAILAEWVRTDANYATRTGHLQGTITGGLNGTYKLTTATVTKATQNDILTSTPGNFGNSAALNWYLASINSAVNNVKSTEKKTII